MLSIRKSIFWFILILINITCLEVTLHIYYKVKHGFWMWDNPFALKNYIIPVNDRLQVYKLKSNYHSSCLNINKLGYRGKIVNNPKVLVLGDSVPFGAGVCDNETYSYFLNKLGIASINGGVPSYNFQQSYRRWLNDFNFTKKYKIVTVQAANDVSLLTYFQNKWNENSNWLEGYFGNKSNWVFFYSSIAHYLKAVHDKIISKKAEKIKQSNYIANSVKIKFFNNINKILDKFIEKAHKENKKLIFISINPFYYINDLKKSKKLKLWNVTYNKYIKLWNNLIKKINMIMKKKAKENKNVYYFDIVSKFDKQNRDLLYKDFIHYNKKGNKLFAKYLKGFMRENRIE